MFEGVFGVFTADLAIAAVVAAFSGIIHGYTGFGAALVMAPLLSLLFGPVEAIAVMVISALLGSVHVYPGAARLALWRERRRQRGTEIIHPPRSAAEQPPKAAARPAIAIEPEPARAATGPAAPPRMVPPKPARPAAQAAPRQRALPIDRGARGYALPPLELLNEPESQTIENEQELLDRAHKITQKLREFSVGGSVVAVHPGPVVTTFEFKPDAGVKYCRVTSLADDLCLAMQAESVLIERLAGKSTVGIQIPNRVREQISACATTIPSSSMRGIITTITTSTSVVADARCLCPL